MSDRHGAGCILTVRHQPIPCSLKKLWNCDLPNRYAPSRQVPMLYEVITDGGRNHVGITCSWSGC